MITLLKQLVQWQEFGGVLLQTGGQFIETFVGRLQVQLYVVLTHDTQQPALWQLIQPQPVASKSLVGNAELLDR